MTMLNLASMLLPLPKGIIDGLLLVTQELAKQILKEFNQNNFRDVHKATVETFAVAMEAGDWTLNYHSPILLWKDKYYIYELINGQHRLETIIKTGIPQMFVVRILPRYLENTFDTEIIDREFVRRMDQVFKNRGVPSPRSASRIARLILLQTRNKAEADDIKQCIRMYEEHQKAIDFITNLKTAVKHQACVNRGYQTTLVRMYYTHPSRVEAFHDQYVNAYTKNPKTDKAARMLREHFAKGYLKKYKGTGNKIQNMYAKRCELAMDMFGKKQVPYTTRSVKQIGSLLPLPKEIQE